MTEYDFMKIQEKALQEGLPYQCAGPNFRTEPRK